MSIISFLAIVIISLYFANETFQRKNYTTIFTNDILLNPNYALSDRPIVVSLTNLYGQHFDNAESLFTLQGLFYEHINTTGKTTNFVTIPVEKCSISSLGEYGDYYKSLEIERLYCVDRNALKGKSLYGTYGDLKPWSFFSILISKCVNSTQIGVNKCKPAEMIESSLSIVSVSVLILNINIDHRNFEEPGVLYLNSLIVQISTTIFKKFEFAITNISYETDRGLIFPDVDGKEYFSIKITGESTDNRNNNESLVPGYFSNLSFVLNNMQSLYYRKYSKFQDLLANIGGVIKGILVISTIFENFLVRRLYLIELCNNLFYYDEPKEAGKYFSNIKCISVCPVPNKSTSNLSNEIFFNKSNQEIIKQLQEENMKNIRIHQSKFKLSLVDKICPSFFFQSYKTLLISLLDKFVQKQISIEHLIKRINEVKQIKNLLFSPDELIIFNFIKKPWISSLITEKKSQREDHQLKLQSTFEKLSKSDMNSQVIQRMISLATKYLGRSTNE